MWAPSRRRRRLLPQTMTRQEASTTNAGQPDGVDGDDDNDGESDDEDDDDNEVDE